MKTNSTATSIDVIISRETFCNGADFGFSKGWGAAYTILRRLAVSDTAPPATSNAAALAVAILNCHEVEEACAFDPKDPIYWDDEEGDCDEDE